MLITFYNFVFSSYLYFVPKCQLCFACFSLVVPNEQEGWCRWASIVPSTVVFQSHHNQYHLPSMAWVISQSPLVFKRQALWLMRSDILPPILQKHSPDPLAARPSLPQGQILTWDADDDALTESATAKSRWANKQLHPTSSDIVRQIRHQQKGHTLATECQYLSNTQSHSCVQTLLRAGQEFHQRNVSRTRFGE